MLNEENASKLISKSLQGSLSDQDSAQVNELLAQSEQTRAFADLSSVIQNSVAGLAALATDGDPSIGSGLSEQARSRLKGSVAAALSSTGSSAEQSLVEVAAPPKGKTDDSRFNEQTMISNTGETHKSSFGDSIALRENQPQDVRETRSRFTLLRKLGEGGLGNVWLVRDEKLNRNVAIKEMNQMALQSPKAWQRFNREAEITGYLEHPNVVPLYMYGSDSSTGEPFYAMRFVGKRTLADAINEYHDRCSNGEPDPLMLHRLLSTFLDICQAIAYAHSRGVIHRDLKPENVALDSYGQTIVLDWGLAKLMDDSELGEQLLGSLDLSDEALAQTLDGEVIGTPLYMSPEQAAGEDVCLKTDIYGLGSILFAILSGSAPHANSHVNEEGQLPLREVLKSISDNDSPKPRDYNPRVSIELEKICVKAMSRKKYARHESASILADEVERWMVDQGRRQTEYENVRMEGRELRANVQSAVRDLETNVRFMSVLPPIQELIRSQPGEETDIWRDRLATIFSGLLNAKPNYRTIIYSKVDGDQFQTLVRVERHSTIHSNIRSIPRSRLSNGEISDYQQKVISQDPDEVFTSLACNPLCDSSVTSQDRVSLVAGVPVFDHETEEIFGFVIIECDLDRVVESAMNRRFAAADIVMACDTFHVMMHLQQPGGLIEEHVAKPISDVLPKFDRAVAELKTKSEFIDESDRLIYGARMWLIPNVHGLMFLLSRK